MVRIVVLLVFTLCVFIAFSNRYMKKHRSESKYFRLVAVVSRVAGIGLALLFLLSFALVFVNPYIQKNRASHLCSKFIVGSFYDKDTESRFYKNKVFDQNGSISFIFPMSFDNTAKCTVLLDSDGKILKSIVLVE